MTRRIAAVMAEAAARAPLTDRTGDLAEIGAELVPFLNQVDLRVDPSHAGLAPYPLPLEPDTAWHDNHAGALWLGPDEWLVLGSTNSADDVAAGLAAAFHHVHHSVVDVSANRVAIALTSEDRFALLSHVCPLDLDPVVWGAGRCAQTLLGRAQVILFERAETTQILVRPSFADYVVDLLLQVRRASGDMGA
jgi:sarcosine oxidase, subunit gamma